MITLVYLNSTYFFLFSSGIELRNRDAESRNIIGSPSQTDRFHATQQGSNVDMRYKLG